MTEWLEFYRNRPVLVTGHTGFKGAWLALWLQQLGARVFGFALPPRSPSLFDAARVNRGMDSTFGDIRDPEAVNAVLARARPEILFHMAAQAFVRFSYTDPIETFGTNVMGTAVVLDAVRRTTSARAIVNVTSDKCYENDGTLQAFSEDNRLGGADPYSASKAAAELVTTSFRASYFGDGGPFLASARAGNVIGGGDWGSDRLVPDLIAGAASRTLPVLRNPYAVRPWQFVLEPLSGYLQLACALATHGQPFAEAWNFGPRQVDAIRVHEIAHLILAKWGVELPHKFENSTGPQPHEAHYLRLNTEKAVKRLGWQPLLSVGEAVAETVEWYKTYHTSREKDMDALTRRQVDDYVARLLNQTRVPDLGIDKVSRTSDTLAR